MIIQRSEISTPTIILASSSPYRKALLKQLGLDFICESPDIDESPNIDETISQLALRLSSEKAAHIAKRHTEGLIIGSDQTAECKAQRLRKPGNHKNAKRQLMQMRGNRIDFYTGLCLFNASTKTFESDIVHYSVTFRTLTEEEINQYLIKEQPFHCAGSFKSEALGITLVQKMAGEDPSALIGLPLIRLSEMLRRQGIKLP